MKEFDFPEYLSFKQRQRDISMSDTRQENENYMPVVGDYFTLVRRFSTGDRSWTNDIFLCTYTDDDYIIGMEQKWGHHAANTFHRDDCAFKKLRHETVAAMLEGHKYGPWVERQKSAKAKEPHLGGKPLIKLPT